MSKCGMLSLSREQVRRALLIPAQSVIAEGFDGRVLDKLDVGYSNRLKRTIVPLYDDKGEVCLGFLQQCVGYAARSGMLSSGFKKSSHVYGLHLLKPSSPYVLLLERVTDVWRALEAGLPAVSTMHYYFANGQMTKLAKLNKPVLVLFNRGEESQTWAATAQRKLRALGVDAQHVHLPEEFSQVSDMSAGELADRIHGVLA